MNNNQRIGETAYTTYGELATIIQYENYSNIIVKFENGYTTKTNYQHFKEGNVKNVYRKFLYDVGFLGEGKYDKRSYQCWKNMFKRCYDKEYSLNKPTYKNCVVCDEWLNYSNFAEWYNKNYYTIKGQTMCLDKDILHKGNKVYSPDNCVFVPNGINCLFTKSDGTRGEYPIGVTYNKVVKKFQVRCNNGNNKGIDLGYYTTTLEAFNSYKKEKEKVIKQVADEYKDLIPNKLYIAMYNWKVEITD